MIWRLFLIDGGVSFKCHKLSDLMGCLWPGHLDFTNFYKISQSDGTNTVNEQKCTYDTG